MTMDFSIDAQFRLMTSRYVAQAECRIYSVCN